MAALQQQEDDIFLVDALYSSSDEDEHANDFDLPNDNQQGSSLVPNSSLQNDPVQLLKPSYPQPTHTVLPKAHIPQPHQNSHPDSPKLKTVKSR